MPHIFAVWVLFISVRINDHIWNIYYVSEDNPVLIDRTGTWTLAVTIPKRKSIYLSDNLFGNQLITVLLHEMTHATLWEFGIINDIRKYCYPENAIDMEELVCNIVADYAQYIFMEAYRVLGGQAIFYMPMVLERLVA